MTLYNISKTSKGFVELWAEIDESETGEITPEQIDQLYELDLSQEQTYQALCYALKNEQARQAAIKTEVDRLRKESSVSGNKIQSIKDFMNDNMEHTGIKKIETEIFKITRCGNSQPTITAIVPIGIIPSYYKLYELPKLTDDECPPTLRYKAKQSLNKERVLESYKDGDNFSLCGISVVKGHHVRVR